ncbi:hypothetical protein SEA_BURLEY_15 [Gordonia phage Burley]|nr:hypothetical protein SEA_RUNHAAR_15 [Gordonia phage Runhaar]QZD97797.1 hypothetical protein SEA_NADMEG_15 [Gordonia phage Nadmeg]USH44676.1 hypothetical protein SEA_BURLEY_15 [Gordonia phage Burley]UVK63980.1 hypothetical protein SEA_VARDY_15 [Gordonia phage Vardy]WAB10400.1 hypothetical protein SEA_PHEPPER_15 [Gordonia phage Phepper]
MSESILNSTKKMLGIDADYDAFDMDVILHINGALSTLNQLGLGPEEGFMIEDETAEWGDLLEDDMRLNSVKSLIYLKVRLVFDPPSTSFVLSAMQEQIRELEWRLNVYREGRDRA